MKCKQDVEPVTISCTSMTRLRNNSVCYWLIFTIKFALHGQWKNMKICFHVIYWKVKPNDWLSSDTLFWPKDLIQHFVSRLCKNACCLQTRAINVNCFNIIYQHWERSQEVDTYKFLFALDCCMPHYQLKILIKSFKKLKINYFN